MRQLQLTVPVHRRDDLEAVIAEHDGTAVRRWTADVDGGGDVQAYVELSLSNRRVGPFLRAVEDLDVATATVPPRSVLALRPGRDRAPDDLVDVDPLSAHEVYLAGLQSVGSWRGFLGYAAVAGAVVWIGMLIGSTFLLIAAMLIAPFAGPAMNTALATATGDSELLGRTVLRYGAAIAVVVFVAGVLHLLLGTDIATAEMVETAKVSAVAVLLPLAAGAAGALNLVQADRSSLVSGAATGVLVAAALAPPAGLVGMAAVIGEWSMVRVGLFLLALQLAGLNLAGSAMFMVWGVRPGRTRYGRSSWRAAWVAAVVSLAVTAGLVTYQLADPPSLQRSSIEQRISAEISRTIDRDPDVGLVDVDARFTRPDIPDQDTLLAVTFVHTAPGVDPTALEQRLSSELTETISGDYDVVALVSVTALPGPPSTPD